MSTPPLDPREDPLFTPLTIDEAATAAGRTRRTIDQWIAADELKVFEIGQPPRRVVVKRHLLDLEIRKRKAALKGRPRKRPPEPPDTPDPGRVDPQVKRVPQ